MARKTREVYGYIAAGKTGNAEVAWKFDPATHGLGEEPVDDRPKNMQTCYREYEFCAPYDQNPTHENKAFWEATPSFSMNMAVTNPDADFEVGREYYLDFSRAPR